MQPRLPRNPCEEGEEKLTFHVVVQTSKDFVRKQQPAGGPLQSVLTCNRFWCLSFSTSTSWTYRIKVRHATAVSDEFPEVAATWLTSHMYESRTKEGWRAAQTRPIFCTSQVTEILEANMLSKAVGRSISQTFFHVPIHLHLTWHQPSLG